MHRQELREATALAKENAAKLRPCEYHVFIDATPEVVLGKRYRCKNCGGEIDSHAHYWFRIGYTQGRGVRPKGAEEEEGTG